VEAGEESEDSPPAAALPQTAQTATVTKAFCSRAAVVADVKVGLCSEAAAAAVFVEELC
jgi:hypothetical protein